MTKHQTPNRDSHPMPQPGGKKPAKYRFTDWAAI